MLCRVDELDVNDGGRNLVIQQIFTPVLVILTTVSAETFSQQQETLQVSLKLPVQDNPKFHW